MLTPYLPFPPSSGGQIRSFNLIKYLSKKHDITLFSLIKSDEEKQYISELEKYCKKVRVFKRSKSPWTLRNVLLTGFGRYPFLVIRNLAPAEKRAVEKELSEEKYDLIHAETFYVMPHIPRSNVPVLLVDQTIEYLVYRHYVDEQAPIFLRPLLSIDVTKLKFWEKKYWQQADKVVAVSEADKGEMHKLDKDLNVEIVPNGVNLDFFKVRTSWSSKKPKILFVANFKWMQNVEAAEILIDKVFPVIREKVSGAILSIVGQHIPEELIVRKGDGVEIVNLAEKDEKGIQKAYYEASVFVSPLHGPGGTRLKHLGAMASKLPLVTTPVGAEGLGAKDGENIMIREKPEELAKATLKILTDVKFAKKMAENARELVVREYSWQKMGQMLDELYGITAHGK